MRASSSISSTSLVLLLCSLLSITSGFTTLTPSKTKRAIRPPAFLLSSKTSNESEKEEQHTDMALSRRSAISKGTAAAITAIASATTLSTGALPANALPSDNYINTPQTIVITGCNSGIGLDAVKRLSTPSTPRHRLILACRTLAKAQSAMQQVMEEIPDANVELIPAECDLASLESIKSFVENTVGKEDQSLDVVCYNAGISRNTAATDVLRTKEGLELTVGTNHFGHFYLNHLLLPKIKQNTGRIVVTASSVHDPESPGGAQGSKATLGTLEGLKRDGNMFEMVDGEAFDADKAYKDSKLCNVLFTRELQRRMDKAGTGINVNCFSPGLIVGTGLFRDQNPIFTKVFDIAATNLLKVGESVHWGGGTVEYMMLDKTVASKGGYFYTAAPGSSKYGDDAYGKQFTVAEVSKEARDDGKARELWELSEKLVGISA